MNQSKNTSNYENALLIGVSLIKTSTGVFLNVSCLLNCLIFSYIFCESLPHTRYSENIHGIKIPLPDNLVSHVASLCFPLLLSITWVVLHFNISPSTSFAKTSGMCPVNFILWLIFFKQTEMTCSLCWFYGSPRHSGFSCRLSL